MRQHRVQAVDADLSMVATPSHRINKANTVVVNNSSNSKSEQQQCNRNKLSASPVSVVTDLQESSSLHNAAALSPIAIRATPTIHHHDVKLQQRRVHFGGVYQRFCHHQKPRSRKQLWYTSKEIRAFRVEIYALNLSCGGSIGAVTSNKKGASYNSSNIKGQALLVQKFEATDSWRGLEHVKVGQLMQKLEHRQKFVRSCLAFAAAASSSSSHNINEQQPLMIMGRRSRTIDHSEALAAFASQESRLDRERAIHLATQDALEACQDYYTFFKSEKEEQQYAAKGSADSVESDSQSTTSSTKTTTGGSYSSSSIGSKLWGRERRREKSSPRHTKDKHPFKTQIIRNLTKLHL